MDESTMQGLSEDVASLYDAEGWDKKLPSELRPFEMVLPMTEELGKWRKAHVGQDSVI